MPDFQNLLNLFTSGEFLLSAKFWIVLHVVTMFIDGWLGVTKKVKSSSIIELTIRRIVSIIKFVLRIKRKPKGEVMNLQKALKTAELVKASNPMTEAYDIKVLGKRLKDAGLENAEQLAGEIYLVSKDWAKESAPLSKNKIDDIAAPFYDQADELVLPQIEKLSPA